MSTPSSQTRCYDCSAPLDPAGQQCRVCGSARHLAAPPYPNQASASYSNQPPAPYANQPSAPYSWPSAPENPALPVPYAPQQFLPQQQIVTMVSPKSAGIAVLLTFLFLGAGHLYANRVTTGVILIISEVLLAILSATGIGLIVTIPIYVILLPIAMLLAASAAKNFNYRNGLVLR